MKKYLIILFLLIPAVCFSAPVLWFSDLTDGCVSCLTDDTVTGQGAIVTVWGVNLGSSRGSSKVYVGSDGSGWTEAAHYYYWGNADGASGGGPANLYATHQMQEISFSIASGTATGSQGIRVEVESNDSNVLSFTTSNDASRAAFFVKNSGNDSTGNGSWSTPWKTITHVIDQAEARVSDGDVVYIWGDVTSTATNGRWDFDTMVGTASAMIGFIAYPGQTPQIDNGTDRGIGNPNQGEGYCEYIVLSKIKFQDLGTYNDHLGHSRIVGLSYTGDNTEGGLAFFTGSGKQSGSKYFGNYIANYGAGTSNQDHTLYFTVRGEGPISGWELGWNVFSENLHRNTLYYYDENACGQVTSDIYIHHNVVYKGVSATMMSGEDGCNVGEVSGTTGTEYYYHNLIIASGIQNAQGADSQLIVWIGDQHQSDIRAFNNTFYGYKYNGCSDASGHDNCAALLARDGFGAGGGSGTWHWKNNIIIDLYNLRYDHTEESGTAPTDDGGNIWFSEAETPSWSVPSWDTVWGGQNSDPLLIDPTGLISGDYGLQVSSPAIDGGISISGYSAAPFYNYDLYGTELTIATPDVGAIQHTAPAAVSTVSGTFNFN